MADTLVAAVPAKKGVFKISDVNDTSRDIHCDLSRVQRAKSRDVEEWEGYCGKSKAPGAPTVTYTIEGKWNGSANEIDAICDALMDDDDPHLYEWFPEGEASAGLVRYYGSGYLRDYNINAATPGVVLVDLVMEGQQDTRGTSPSP
jgi:hypothetical protein